jgi:lipoprotein-anchoring transpeptidase ErfK/SrfK
MSTTRRRSLGFGRGTSVALAACGAACLLPSAAGAEAPAGQPLVALRTDHVARTAPAWGARAIETVAARRPLTRVRTVLPELGRTFGGGTTWVRVRLPGRPNGHAGWIPARRTVRRFTSWHLGVDLSARRVTISRRGRVVRRYRAIIGTSSTPTPRGRFFVEEAVALSAAASGGPFALATSARSNVLQEFAGGPGQIALHGTANLSGALGTAASHGCIRLDNGAITWLSRRIGGGVPLTIRR